jgi:hypothetical protein
MVCKLKMGKYSYQNAVKGFGSIKNFVVNTISNKLNLEPEQVETAFDCPTRIDFIVDGHDVSVFVED